MSYTKGPWNITLGSGGFEIYKTLTEEKLAGSNGRLITKKSIATLPFAGDGIESAANVKLIAASPEMLEVLQTIENDAGQVPEWLWKRIEDVINKATV